MKFVKQLELLNERAFISKTFFSNSNKFSSRKIIFFQTFLFRTLFIIVRKWNILFIERPKFLGRSINNNLFEFKIK